MVTGLRVALPLLLLLAAAICPAQAPQAVTRDQAQRALRKAAEFYLSKVSTQGGYHYYYAEDLSYGRSEQAEGSTQVEVQREATPRVALAYLHAYDATRDRFYLEAARAAAHALVRGQHCSGGWDYLIEFDPEKRKQYPYRADHNCEAAKSGRHYTTLDDNVTQAAVRVLMRVDKELEFSDAAIHESALYALDQLLKAQYPNGAWPQRYHEFPDPARFPVRKASYPESWPKTWPGAGYRHLYTFNDNAILDMIDMLLEAEQVYGQQKYRAAAEKGGGFILLAQMPEPQPAWAQQYDGDMHPAWARVFEPPSVTGGESQAILKTLLLLYRETGERKYLDPVPRAVAYLRRSALPRPSKPSEVWNRFRPGEPVLARFYELRTNRPLYITKGTRVSVTGQSTTNLDGYQLSYSDESVITHYGVLVSGARLEEIEREAASLPARSAAPARRPGRLRDLSPWDTPGKRPQHADVAAVIAAMDPRGAWLEEGSIGKSGRVASLFAAHDMVVTIGDRSLPLKENETLQVFQGHDEPRRRIIRSATFARNVEALSAFLRQTQ